MKRACYTVRFLFADRADLRNSYYIKFGRFALIGSNEYTTQIPEFSDLSPAWNQRARGFGATRERPVSLGAEENALCWRHLDKWYEQDIVLHEFAHGLHLLGAFYAIPGFQRRLQSLYSTARASGKWYNTYSLSTEMEYLVRGQALKYHSTFLDLHVHTFKSLIEVLFTHEIDNFRVYFYGCFRRKVSKVTLPFSAMPTHLMVLITTWIHERS